MSSDFHERGWEYEPDPWFEESHERDLEQERYEQDAHAERLARFEQHPPAPAPNRRRP